MTGRDCDELRMALVMTYVLPVIATRRFSPRLWTSDNGNRVTDRWRTIVTKTSNGIREGKIPPRSNKQRDMVVKTRRRQRAGASLRGDLCYDSWSLSHLGYFYPGTTPVMIKLDHNRSYSWVWIAQVTKAPTIRESKAQNPMVTQFMLRFKWADLGLRKVIVPRDCVVQRGALFRPTPRVAFGGD